MAGAYASLNANAKPFRKKVAFKRKEEKEVKKVKATSDKSVLEFERGPSRLETVSMAQRV